MEFSDSKRNMRYLLREFKKTDEFYKFFRDEFSELLYSIIFVYYPEIKPNSALDELIVTYATELINSTETVIDKDRNFPKYRLIEELEVMNRLVGRLPENKHNDVFIAEVHMKSKEQLVNYFTDIFDLSASGFRLLEKNAKIYNWEFFVNFNRISKVNE